MVWSTFFVIRLSSVPIRMESTFLPIALLKKPALKLSILVLVMPVCMVILLSFGSVSLVH